MPTDNHYIVKSGSFEGPLELLLELIEKRKLFINEVSLSEVTNDYLSHVKKLEKYNYALITHFLIIAATLILIKSKSLLPQSELTDEENQAIGDLEIRLALYKVIKEAGFVVKSLFGKNIIFETQKDQVLMPVFAPDSRLNKEFIYSIMKNLLNAFPEEKPLSEVMVRKIMSIEEMMNNLTEKIQETGTLSFKNISSSVSSSSPKETKIYAIVSFLAMLELVRNGIIDVLQKDLFSDMDITKMN